MNKINFLHIGKTGGSAVKFALNQWGNPQLKLHGHATNMAGIPEKEKIFFFLRDPISRFISGFYSRQRKGQPRYYSEHSPLESKVFATFKTPNELTLALINSNLDNHELAKQAMLSIEHFSHLHKWFISLDYFKSRLDDVLFIGFQSQLNLDFDRLKIILKAPEHICLPVDEVDAHRNPAGLDYRFDKVASDGLLQWYADDYEFLKFCENINFS